MQTVPPIIQTYVDAHNAIDVDRMLGCLNNDVRFTNLTRGKVTAETEGLQAFEELARFGARAFRSRRQTITGAITVGTRAMISVHYEATVAIDLPNGWKEGQELSFDGASYFEIVDGKIAMIIDAS